MNDGPRYITLRDYLRVIRERRIVIALVTIVFGAAALGYSLRQPTVYAAETSVEFQDANVDTSVLGTYVVSNEQTPEQRAAVGAQYITRTEIAERARRLLGTDEPAGTLQASVAAFPEARTHLVVISARWGDPQFAARLADAFATAASEVASEDARTRYRRAAQAQRRIRRELGDSESQALTRTLLSAQIAQLEELAQIVRPVEIRRKASVPTNPIAPKPVRNLAIGLLLGLVMGALAAFGRDALDRRFRGSHEITEALKLPLIGYVQEEALGRSIVGAGDRDALDGSQLEGFRILRTNVEFLEVDKPMKLLLVTSSLPEEGKTTVSGALAATYAMAGKRTLLVECDLRRPQLAARFGLKPTPGLTDYLAGNASPADILQSIEIAPPSSPNGAGPGAASQGGVPLVCIVAGTQTPQPAEMLRSKRVQTFLEQVVEVYDIVILDTPPLLSVVDTLELLPAAHGVVLCVRASRTTREQAKAAKAALEHMPDRPAGIVVTGTRGDDDDQYGYYSYGYAYDAH